MFKYTKAAIDLIVEDFKKYALVFKYCSLVISIGYFTFAILTKIGNFYANAILGVLFILYLIFEIITDSLKSKPKKVKKIVRRTYKWTKIAVNMFSLAAAIYSIYTAVKNVSAISIILTTLMIIMWVLDVLLEIVVEILQSKYAYLIAGFNKDIEDIKKPIAAPVKKAKDLFKKMKGEEIEPEPKKSKEIEILEKRINANKKKNK
ncbi:MAG: hypothetical protein LBM03_00490 [Erysipelotrichaceae bacterium]|jgi:hypothetical protein|nr:hypothetical protein [Erysipelotrichaceae bacterium]